MSSKRVRKSRKTRRRTRETRKTRRTRKSRGAKKKLMRLNRRILKGRMDLIFDSDEEAVDGRVMGRWSLRPGQERMVGAAIATMGSIPEYQLEEFYKKLVEIDGLGLTHFEYQGSGKDSIVCKAKKADQEEVAVKIFFRDELLDTEELLEEETDEGKKNENTSKIKLSILENELLPLNKMTNPDGTAVSRNVMHCIDRTDDGTPKIYYKDGYFAIILPFYEGGDLFAAAHGPNRGVGVLSELICNRYIRGILTGLAAMHEKGLYHRDIKPENIMLTTSLDGTTYPVIIDLGSCTTFKKEEEALRNKHGSEGYIPFLATEKYDDGKINNEKIDIWAAGIILFALLFNQNPFTIKSGRWKHQVKNPSKKEEIIIPKNHYSKGIIDLLQYMTNIDPKKRPTAQECLGHPCFREEPSPMIAEPEPVEQRPIAAFGNAGGGYSLPRTPHISTSPPTISSASSSPRIRTSSSSSSSD